MMIHAVIDTNVLVSSLLTKKRDAATVLLVNALFERRFCAVYNSEIVEEYEEVLSRPEFHFESDIVKSIIDTVKKNGICANRIPSDDSVIDPKDVVFYEVAISIEGSYLVTGNLKHFPQKTIVVTPTEMLRILEEYECKNEK